jgi:hypothetical protein
LRKGPAELTDWSADGRRDEYGFHYVFTIIQQWRPMS